MSAGHISNLSGSPPTSRSVSHLRLHLHLHLHGRCIRSKYQIRTPHVVECLEATKKSHFLRLFTSLLLTHTHMGPAYRHTTRAGWERETCLYVRGTSYLSNRAHNGRMCPNFACMYFVMSSTCKSRCLLRNVEVFCIPYSVFCSSSSVCIDLGSCSWAKQATGLLAGLSLFLHFTCICLRHWLSLSLPTSLSCSYASSGEGR